MKLTCSCGASAEFRDGISGGADADKWQDRHAFCQKIAAPQPPADIVLPLLTEPETLGNAIDGWCIGYTEKQMISYARAAVLMDRERRG